MTEENEAFLTWWNSMLPPATNKTWWDRYHTDKKFTRSILSARKSAWMGWQAGVAYGVAYTNEIKEIEDKSAQ